jgi:hypothetical protein
VCRLLYSKLLRFTRSSESLDFWAYYPLEDGEQKLSAVVVPYIEGQVLSIKDGISTYWSKVRRCPCSRRPPSRCMCTLVASGRALSLSLSRSLNLNLTSALLLCVGLDSCCAGGVLEPSLCGRLRSEKSARPCVLMQQGDEGGRSDTDPRAHRFLSGRSPLFQCRALPRCESQARHVSEAVVGSSQRVFP